MRAEGAALGPQPKKGPLEGRQTYSGPGTCVSISGDNRFRCARDAMFGAREYATIVLPNVTGLPASIPPGMLGWALLRYVTE